jgi:hypothetical protein
MEIMYFTFGVLTMVAMISVGAIVYGIVKVFKQEKQIKDIQKDIQWNFNDMGDRFRDYHQRIEHVYTNAKDMSNAYTDMRIDKLEDKLSGNSTKKLIKG